MKALDFNYDGLFLSDFGCVLCTFDNASFGTYSVGSEISFNTTPINFGKRHLLTSVRYDSCLSAEFTICKNAENLRNNENKYFTIEEQRDILRWLNRPNFHTFYLLDEGYEDIYYNASFNVSKIELAGNVIGFSLKFFTDRPFGTRKKYKKNIAIIAPNESAIVKDISDEIGYIYADVVVTCNQSGTLTIVNQMDGRITEIKNCVSGETITMKDMIIETNDTTHRKTIMNDFNFVFLRISNTFKNKNNRLTFSLPCTAVISYSPIRKVGV